MMFRFILLVLPAIALASIDVEISIRDAKDPKVHYKGYDISTISDTERTTFKVNDDSLIKAVNSFFGKSPSDVMVSKVFPVKVFESDLNLWYKWKEVTRTLMPRSSKIFWASGTLTVVAREIFENNSTIPATFNVGITRSVVNTVWSSWRTSGELSDVKINYAIKNNVANVEEEPFSYTSSWGQDTLQLQKVTVGASTNMDIILQPGEAVVARLEAKTELVKVEMEYDAHLSGEVLARFKKLFAFPYFDVIPISLCMEIAGISNQKTSREFIDIEFFSDSKVVVSDLRQGHILMELH